MLTYSIFGSRWTLDTLLTLFALSFCEHQQSIKYLNFNMWLIANVYVEASAPKNHTPSFTTSLQMAVMTVGARLFD